MRSNTERRPGWICCQIGSREHYAVPRALARRGALDTLFTDAWARPHAFSTRWLPRRLRERFHPELAGAQVRAWTAALLMREFFWRLRRQKDWRRIMQRNRWFGEAVVCELKSNHAPDAGRAVYAYSYAALEVFAFARSRRWPCILGQMDPGPVEEDIVARLHARNGTTAAGWQRAPRSYWRDWRRECELADRILVNSEWSREALAQAGIPEEKLVVIPLVYEAPAGTKSFVRSCPDAFSAERPLRVLFLGQVILRKGIAELQQAMRLLRGMPVELWLVGPENGDWPRKADEPPGIRRFGVVSRGETQEFYRQADVFLFPTHSDGFGLTQLEAQAWKLPVIASRACGEVVTDGENGLVLEEVSGEAISAALQRLVQRPGLLKELAARSFVRQEFSLDSMAGRLIELAEAVSAKVATAC